MNHLKGLYGKLPSHGDFVSRDLPPAFVNIWDEWLQRGMLSSQEVLTDDWLDYYLTSPVWRFVLSSGAIDQSSWVGVMIPSVDRVGRYFPFTLLIQLPADTICFDVMSSSTDLFIQMENLALEGLDGHLAVDQLYQKLQKIYIPTESYHQCKVRTENNATNIAFKLDYEEQSSAGFYGVLLDQLYRKDAQSYSLWHTQGSQHVCPGLLVSKAMPTARSYVALIDGKWDQYNWKSPLSVCDPMGLSKFHAEVNA
jgi:type VI secretion system protein ImpM